ncbi:aldose 1-epimerase family protein [Leucobacter ruminantium]|uniref:Aldose 1-epimerase family protein n=1 Tax=Leucobacter ruminantium TaxID=1289170 RepID=A0A939RYQ1_9MICO|nr:aldose 1-epimerase family protein [Leucobacter ruminantium]MBO1805101.1 aldose 1-epimerase family protein [Leucobacter ruminantium]
MGTHPTGRPLDEVLPRIGSLAQLVACESYVLSDGPAAASRRIRLTVGELDVELLPDRGLDIGAVRFAGTPVAWISPTGLPRRASGDDFGRTFGGGLLTTCGLRNYGPAALDEGEAHPMHGRYSTLAATVRRVEADERGAAVEAEVVEAELFGAHLRSRRRIEVPLGSASIRVEDVVTNLGARPVAPMVLYHLNFGWPLVDEGTRLETGAAKVVPRDDAARAGAWNLFPALADPYPEQVFLHELPEGPAEVRIARPGGFGATVRFDTATLPGLVQWRVAEPGCAVLGIEPASAPTILGRADARARGLLRPLAPGESRRYAVEVAFAHP